MATIKQTEAVKISTNRAETLWFLFIARRDQAILEMVAVNVKGILTS